MWPQLQWDMRCTRNGGCSKYVTRFKGRESKHALNLELIVTGLGDSEEGLGACFLSRAAVGTVRSFDIFELNANVHGMYASVAPVIGFAVSWERLRSVSLLIRECTLSCSVDNALRKCDDHFGASTIVYPAWINTHDSITMSHLVHRTRLSIALSGKTSICEDCFRFIFMRPRQQFCWTTEK